jgi:LPPG:FO 2-phospho-L-lactate transferase
VRVTLLCGGVGGARFALGLCQAVEPAAVTVIVNVGDDFEHWGLRISPDLDTVLYTLAGRVGEQGWGVAGDTRHAMGSVAELGGASWFILTDRDIGLHLARTERLAAGARLSAITAQLAERLGVAPRLIPASDDPLRTMIDTDQGELGFQQWFVKHRGAPPVRGVRFAGAEAARPAPGVLDAIADADRVLLAPSNPFISLDPILAVAPIRAALAARRSQVVAVTPIIAGAAVKGPLAAMLTSLGHERSALGVARYLRDVCGGFVLDTADAELGRTVERELGLRVACTTTLMRDDASRLACAQTALAV